MLENTVIEYTNIIAMITNANKLFITNDIFTI